MADLIRGTCSEMIEREIMHSRDMERTLNALDSGLAAEGVAWALIGGQTLHHHGYVRYTTDIDILTRPEGLERIHERAFQLGLRPRFQGARKSLRHSEHKVNVDVICTGEPLGSSESPLVFPDPLSDTQFMLVAGRRVARLSTLIQLKLGSGIWAVRLRDFSDVIELIKSNHLDESFASQLDEHVRAKYLELLDVRRREIVAEEEPPGDAGR